MLQQPPTLEHLALTTLAKTLLDPSSTSKIIATPGAVPLLQRFVETTSSNKDKIAALILTRIALDPTYTGDIGYPLQQLLETFLPLLADPEFRDPAKTTLTRLAASQPGLLINYFYYLSITRGLSLDLTVLLIPLLLDLLTHAELGDKAAQVLWRSSGAIRRCILEPIVAADGIAKLQTASASPSFLVRTHAMLILCDLVFLANVMDQIQDEKNGSLWTTFAKPFVGSPPFIKAAKEITLIHFIEPLTALLSNSSFQQDAARALIDVTRRIGSHTIPLMLDAGVVTKLDNQLSSTSPPSFISHALCLLKDISGSGAGVDAIRKSGLMRTLSDIGPVLTPDDWMLKEILTEILDATAPRNHAMALLGWLHQGAALDHLAAP